MAQNASFGNQGKSLVGKKSKVPFLIRNGGEKLKQVVFPMFIVYITLIGTHRYLQIIVYVEVRGAFCYYLYKKYNKKVQASP